jgi:hypothetical protein
MGVKDMNLIIMQARSMHSNQSIIKVALNKCNSLRQFTQEFINWFLVAFELGLPPSWNSERWFFSVEGYNDSLDKKINSNGQFKDIGHPI